MNEIELYPVENCRSPVVSQVKFAVILLLEPHVPPVLTFPDRAPAAPHVSYAVGMDPEHLIFLGLQPSSLNGFEVERHDVLVDLVYFSEHVSVLSEVGGELWVGGIPE